MPLRDGTGPAGMGPLSGRGMGPCARGTSYGMGRGGRMGYGFGCRGARPCMQWSYVEPTVEDEKQMVKEDVNALKAELEAAEKRLSELESEKN